MIAPKPLKLQITWLSDERGFFVTAEQGGALPLHPQDLRYFLFAWHAKSYYGTQGDWAATHRGRAGVLIPAAYALEFFTALPFNGEVEVVWPEEFESLCQLATHIRSAITEGQFSVDADAWQDGKMAWKLIDDVPAELTSAIVSPAEWVDASIKDVIERDLAVNDAWNEVRAIHPMIDNPRPTAWSSDETDLRVALGLERDPCPFRTCLQLIEPQDETHVWKLQILLQDQDNPDVLVECDREMLRDLERRENLSDFALSTMPNGWAQHAARIRRDIQRWIQILPWLHQETDVNGIEVEVGANQPTERIRETMDTDQAFEFLSKGSVELLDAGYTVFLPSWWRTVRPVPNKLRARIKPSVGAAQGGLFGMQQLLSFDWRISVGEVDLSEEEFHQLADEQQRLLRFRGQWMQLDPSSVQQIRRAMARVGRNGGMSLRDALEFHLLGGANIEDPQVEGEDTFDKSPDVGTDVVLEVEPNDYVRKFFQQLQQAEQIPPLTPSTAFRGVPRKYQLEGAAWLHFLRRYGLGACLADDMGLGKTIQYILYLLESARSQSIPRPNLLICPTSVLGNWQKELERFAPSISVRVHYGPGRTHGEEFVKAAADADLMITSYTLAGLDQADIQAVVWQTICLDEAQNIKNAYTKQAVAIRELRAVHRVAMTGTPIENRLTELWSIFDFLNPGYLGSLRSFSDRFVNAIEKNQDDVARSALQRLVRPFLLRRVKTDPAIELDLPEKTEQKVYVPLTASQATLYESIIQELFMTLDRAKGMARRGLILASLTKLKQVCDHPSLLRGNITGFGDSNKVDRLLEMVAELRAAGERCLIFTQFVDMGHLLEQRLAENLHEPVFFLHGGTPKAERDRLVAYFQQQDGKPNEQAAVFILSLRAGGVGLNLTAANHVFHVDRWWNPAVENQATDRAFRIGQTRHVEVHKFVTLGTLEERIDEMIERKLGLSEQIVGAGENWITEMSTSELRDLFSLRREWVASET